MVHKALGHFRIIDRIGVGGMGEVYRARDNRLGREVAIKTLPDSLACDQERRDRFLLEARAVAALNHHHICTLHDIGEDEGVLYLVMELVDGESLAHRLARGQLPLSEALRLAAETADGLAAAHRQGIIHRDLKPSNIQVTAEGRVKLLDFGLAKITGPEPASPELSQSPTDLVTARHTILGTAAYMSPEQARGQAVDLRADVWGLGVVIIEMLCGRRLFAGDTVADTLAAVLRAPVDFDALPSAVPARVRELLAQMLDRDLDRRLGDLGEAQSVLEVAAAEVAARPGSEDRASKQASAVSGVHPPEERSLLVLPFTNLSADPDNEYFSDGLTEEVISDLSRVGSLRVISRTSAMRLKGTDRGLASLAKELGVGTVLEGSVRRSGSSFRITAQLVDASTDSLMWSDKYGGTVDDVFAIQERVSRAIVEALEVRLTRAEDAALAATPMADARAWDIFLRAHHEINLFTSASLARAGILLEQARDIVGPNPLVLRGLGMLSWQYVNSGLDTGSERLLQAEQYAQLCLELDPQGPHGPTILGLAAQARGDLHGWVRHLSRAAEIDPGDTDVLVWLSHAWNCAGRLAKARPLFERLIATDPLFDFVHFGRGNLARFAGDSVAAEVHYERARELTPSNPGWTMVLADAIASQGELGRATALIEAQDLSPQTHPLAAVCHFMAAAYRGDQTAMDRLLTQELRRSLWHDVQYPRFIAAAWSVAGRVDDSLEWLERCADNGFINYPFYAEHDRLLDNLRGSPRFATFLARVEDRWQRFPGECLAG